MSSPAADRVASSLTFASTQLLAGPLGGINRLAALINSQPEVVESWKANPVTRAFLDAIHPMAMNPDTLGQKTENLLTQYGVSQGLMLAYRLFTDPVDVLHLESPADVEKRANVMTMTSDYFPTNTEDLTPEEKQRYGIGLPTTASDN